MHTYTSSEQDLHFFIHKTKKLTSYGNPNRFAQYFWFENSKAMPLHMARREWLNTVLLNATCVLCFFLLHTFYDAFYLNEINLFLWLFFLSLVSFQVNLVCCQNSLTGLDWKLVVRVCLLCVGSLFNTPYATLLLAAFKHHKHQKPIQRPAITLFQIKWSTQTQIGELLSFFPVWSFNFRRFT